MCCSVCQPALEHPKSIPEPVSREPPNILERPRDVHLPHESILLMPQPISSPGLPHHSLWDTLVPLLGKQQMGMYSVLLQGQSHARCATPDVDTGSSTKYGQDENILEQNFTKGLTRNLTVEQKHENQILELRALGLPGLDSAKESTPGSFLHLSPFLPAGGLLGASFLSEDPHSQPSLSSSRGLASFPDKFIISPINLWPQCR